MTKPPCFHFWTQCPKKAKDTKCTSERKCEIQMDCFKEWRSLGGIMATEQEMDLWDL